VQKPLTAKQMTTKNIMCPKAGTLIAKSKWFKKQIYQMQFSATDSYLCI